MRMKRTVKLILSAAISSVISSAMSSAAFADTEDEKWQSAFNTVIHILHHEIGHALIDQFKIPVVGQEEDAADGFATVAILETYDDPQPILLDAASSWFAMHDEAQKAGNDPQYFDTHDLDIQRAYRIICVAHGYDPDTFAEAAKQAELPDDRLETCADDANQAVASWDALLKDAVRTEEGSGGKVKLDIVDVPEFAETRKRLVDSGIGPEITKWLDESYNWPATLTISFDKCGEENAFYYADDVKVTMCYEFIDYLHTLAEAL
jgi:Putative metallopeptidase